MRGPLVSDSRVSGSPWTGTTRVVHRRSTGPTAQIALGPIGRRRWRQPPGSARHQSRPADPGLTAAARARRVAGDGIRLRRRRRKSDAKAAAVDGGNDQRRRQARRRRRTENRGSREKGKESSPKGTTASGDEERRRAVDTRRTVTGTT
uniref:Uncharacterized protein n=1 Tax=Oryza sativa subsp. japonica TaxID=39947 RepID=Q6EQ62_ORYSJ|nr:hypothetical protein [Oryza sativa Japonica Group]BAD29208.1 hypothetical protein [Oryza sativa Japonica Group]